MTSNSDNLAQKLAPLFTPYKVGALTLRNRIVMSPMSIHGQWDEEQVAAVGAHYRKRAEGGVGLLMAGAVLVDHPTAGDIPSGLTPMYGEESMAGWGAVVKQVIPTGVPFLPQLWHAGAWREQPQSTHPDVPNISPSGMGPADEKIGEPATQAEIDAVIEAFVRSAVNAQSIGFSGVDIAGAHGYLIDQFLWSERNLRDDRYGGDIERRSRFAVEVVEAIRRATGPDFLISFRVSQYKRDDFIASPWPTPQELEAAITPILQAGVDVFNVSSWRFWYPAFPDDSPMGFAGWVKKVTGAPVICGGSVGLDKNFVETMLPDVRTEIGNLDVLAEAFDRGEFDLLALGRALLGDPEWPNKVREGRMAELKPFIRSSVSSHEISAHTVGA
ncbi:MULTISPECIES: 12-oxophytodienoate reductase [unclassified Mycobacterium]|uniref:oxidoreductase n=1 Tax=unclassified Mycobacterium TaxID=2642494 RepID=UPI0029C846C7|nr:MULTISPECIES: 12-oxophytodienoate reductase [unclassified Mycobacterium]